MMDAYDLWRQRDDEMEAELEKLPVCSHCGDPIQEEYYFEIDGEMYCEDCMNDLFKRYTDSYC